MKSSIVSSSNPRSVATAHLNSDQYLDLIVANSLTDSIKIFLSNPDGAFQHQRIISTGIQSRPWSIVVCRINHDQHFDIAVANYQNNNIGIFLGHGNGTFSDQMIVSLASSHPLFVTFADLNNDDHTDLIVTNNGTHSISILLGHGNGSFYHQQIYSTGYDSFPSFIGIADFNQDHNLDLAVTNSGTDNIGIFLGIGNGSFSTQTIFSTNHRSNPSSLVIADFNADHHMDMIVTNRGTGNIGIFLGYGNGSFQLQRTHSIDSHSCPQYINSDYFNRDDQILDLVIIDSINDRIHILLGDGNGSFSILTTYDSEPGSHPAWLNAVDLNQNNQSDLVVVNSHANNILLLTDYFFRPAARQMNYGPQGRRSSLSVVTSDFNNDSILDIAFDADDGIFVIYGFGNGSFNRETMYSLGSGLDVVHICAGDLNNDGQMDLIGADSKYQRLNIFLADGNGTFAPMKSYSTGADSHPKWLALGDFNHDDNLDVISANAGTKDLILLLGNGDGTFSTIINFSISRNVPTYSIAVDHFNADNHLDLVVSEGTGWITIFFGLGNGSFIFSEEFQLNWAYGYLFSLALGHFNSDPHPDIVIADTMHNRVSIFLGHGNGTFTELSKISTGAGSQPYNVIVADLNRDNRSDIAVTNHGSNEVIILFGYGNGSFQLGRTFPTGHGSKPYGIDAADLDNDKDLELVVTSWSTGQIIVLSEYMATKFVNETSYSTGSALNPTSVAIDQLNNDNRSDLVIANSGTNNLHIVFGLNNRTLASPMSFSLDENAHPQYVITCDVNQDHRPDVISVNSQKDTISVIVRYENNTFAKQLTYRTGNDSQPSGIVANDFNNDGRLDLVVANKGTDQIGIFFGFDYALFDGHMISSTLNDMMPWKMVAHDFNHDHILDIAVLLPPNNYFGILLGHNNGSFNKVILHSTIYYFYPLGIAAKDINNDTHIDIIISNTDTIAGVCVFLGYGNGSFAAIIPYSVGKDPILVDMAVNDCNNDRRSDIIFINYSTGKIGVLLGHDDGTFANMTTTSIRDNFYPRSIAVGYFNNDSYLDVAVASSNANSVVVLFGCGNGTFGDLFEYRIETHLSPVCISTGDFNRDNHLDIVIANSHHNSVGIIFGDGNGTFNETIQLYRTGIGSTPFFIDVSDLNNDSILDIAVANYGTNEIVVLFGLRDGTFLLGKSYSTGLGSVPWALVIGDFNNDYRLDIAVAHEQSNNIGIFLGQDIEPFGSIFILENNPCLQPHSLATDDLDHDNRSDIIVASYDNDNVCILLGFNGNRFTKMKEYSTGVGSAPHSITVAHLNNDTHLDIVVTNSEFDNILILFGRGDGTFGNEKTYSTGTHSRPYSVAVNDYNNDRWMDIAVVNYGTSNILLLHGYGNGTFGNKTSLSLGYGYNPSSIVAKDLNHDSLTDIVVVCYNTDHVEVFMQMCLL